MFELIGAGLAGAAAVFGHFTSKEIVAERLRSSRLTENPGIAGAVTGVVTTVVATGIVAYVPIVGIGAALLFGAGVGSGVSWGAWKVRREERKSLNDGRTPR